MARATSAQDTSSEKRRPNLVHKVKDELRQAILSGDLKLGHKLPSEARLTEQYSVSRTVVREAIAALRADGLVESRHGVGVFVLEPKPDIAGLTLLTRINRKISDIVEELELRAPVEVEAAGLAATRCSPAQEADIQAQLMLFLKTIEAGNLTTEADFEFHLAIARASNNARFTEFLAHLGRRTIPRSRLDDAAEGKEARDDRDLRLHQEHRAVAEAIFDRDPDRAREAMRAHLVGSLQRYRAFARLKATDA
ncbi:MAG: FadR family transcriptional regulator [Hyphomicrobiales bacterium]|nr:FadR family transcriptional regulator [Hyphomicrobiales bacterium]